MVAPPLPMPELTACPSSSCLQQGWVPAGCQQHLQHNNALWHAHAEACMGWYHGEVRSAVAYRAVSGAALCGSSLCVGLGVCCLAARRRCSCVGGCFCCCGCF
jgi:hypothetical protein